MEDLKYLSIQTTSSFKRAVKTHVAQKGLTQREWIIVTLGKSLGMDPTQIQEELTLGGSADGREVWNTNEPVSI